MWADLTGVWEGVSSRVTAKVAPLLTFTLKQCLPASDVQYEHVIVNGRRFRVLSLLAEGGYVANDGLPCEHGFPSLEGFLDST